MAQGFSIEWRLELNSEFILNRCYRYSQLLQTLQCSGIELQSQLLGVGTQVPGRVPRHLPSYSPALKCKFLPELGMWCHANAESGGAAPPATHRRFRGDGGTGRIPSVHGVEMAVHDEMRFLCGHDCTAGGKPGLREGKWTTPKWSGDWKPGIKSCEFTQTRLSLSGVRPWLWHSSAGCFWYWKHRAEHGVEKSTIQSPHDTISLWPLLQWDGVMKLASFYCFIASRAVGVQALLPALTGCRKSPTFPKETNGGGGYLLSSRFLKNKNRKEHFFMSTFQ